jgi:hypothetical protein
MAMLSSDRNVDTIARIIKVLKHYLGLQVEYQKLDVVEKLVRLLTVLALFIVLFLFTIAVALMFSLAAAFWLGQHIGMANAFLLMGLLHMGVLSLFFIFRKSWIERPLVRFLAGLILK